MVCPICTGVGVTTLGSGSALAAALGALMARAKKKTPPRKSSRAPKPLQKSSK